eukprot:jgi/Mesvir1/18894/Mv18891-RA.2
MRRRHPGLIGRRPIYPPTGRRNVIVRLLTGNLLPPFASLLLGCIFAFACISLLNPGGSVFNHPLVLLRELRVSEFLGLSKPNISEEEFARAVEARWEEETAADLQAASEAAQAEARAKKRAVADDPTDTAGGDAGEGEGGEGEGDPEGEEGEEEDGGIEMDDDLDTRVMREHDRQRRQRRRKRPPPPAVDLAPQPPIQGPQDIAPGGGHFKGSRPARTGRFPRAIIDEKPALVSQEPQPLISFHANVWGCVFRVRLDDSGWIDAQSPLTFADKLPDGAHTLSILTIDPLGQEDPAPVLFTWMIDTTPPISALSSVPASISNESQPVVRVVANEPRCKFFYQVNFAADTEHPEFVKLMQGSVSEAEALVEAERAGVIELKDLKDGIHRISVLAVDAAGNREDKPKSYQWVVDISPPDTIIHSAPPKLSREPASSFTYRFRLDRGEWVVGPTDKIVGEGYELMLTELGEGPHFFEAAAMDIAGNVDPTPAEYSWAVNILPAQTYLLAKPPQVDPVPTANFTIGSSETQYTYAYSLDGDKWIQPHGHHLVGGNQTFEVTGLADGRHNISVKSTDVTGSSDPNYATYEWEVDTTPPRVIILERPPKVSPVGSARIMLNASEAYSFTYALDGGDPVDSGRGVNASASLISIKGLDEGWHWVDINMSDAVGNAAHTHTIRWVVDQGPPETKIEKKPLEHAHARRPTFSFSSSERDCVFEYRIDRKRWVLTPADSVQNDPLQHTSFGSVSVIVGTGFHTIEVRARDAAGTRDPSPDAFEWVVY